MPLIVGMKQGKTPKELFNLKNIEYKLYEGLYLTYTYF